MKLKCPRKLPNLSVVKAVILGLKVPSAVSGSLPELSNSTPGRKISAGKFLICAPVSLCL